MLSQDTLPGFTSLGTAGPSFANRDLSLALLITCHLEGVRFVALPAGSTTSLRLADMEQYASR
ncbi:hypothetical protein CERSUDRAFT_84799 [Gelatoporia subvermispora B]|uniref:Uncharacterized protein n=1 Tax=Ceriporiopsis subvermispora (strain B) TaxID=914234 RepID=M2QHU8_CERS8|nr:hypothetical protein CERSUDRAFT_84799 [Gelatoporia subvermispora B]